MDGYNEKIFSRQENQQNAATLVSQVGVSSYVALSQEIPDLAGRPGSHTELGTVTGYPDL